MNNCQFKFKPDKIKYLSNVDTLDSCHKSRIDLINKKRIDCPKKKKRLEKLNNDLVKLDKIPESNDYINIRSKLIDEISMLEEEINIIENYDDEIDYYSKTYQILFNYYDIIDGQNPKEFDDKINDQENINELNTSTINNTNINFDQSKYLDKTCNKLD